MSINIAEKEKNKKNGGRLSCVNFAHNDWDMWFKNRLIASKFKLKYIQKDLRKESSNFIWKWGKLESKCRQAYKNFKQKN